MCFPQSVCFTLTRLSPCSLYVTFPPAPPKATYIFFGDKGTSPESRWLRGSGPVPGPRHTEPPQRPTSWRLQHQRDPGSGGRVEPGLTLPCPLHHNVLERSHSLTLTFPVICVYQWRPTLSNNLMCPSHCCLTYRSHRAYLILVIELILPQKSDLNEGQGYTFPSNQWNPGMNI